MDSPYDPFAPGSHPVTLRRLELRDEARGRVFPCDVWLPEEAGGGPLPLAIYSHSSGGNRRSATFLCAHLAGHGHAVAALDHSELVAPELARRDEETGEELAARVEAVIAARVPDVRLLLDHLLGGGGGVAVDPGRVGIVGHSFGGWTALATAEADARVASVVALAPGGIARPRPGVLRLSLAFTRHREVPLLFLAAELDVPIPLDQLLELFGRAPEPRRMVVLRRADHEHFVDDVEGDHEALRALVLPPDAAWLTEEMLPATELCPGEEAHRFVRGLTLAHLDATLRGSEPAARWLEGDVEAALRGRGVDAFVPRMS